MSVAHLTSTEQRIHEQVAQDRVWEAEKHTGVELDRITFDYSIWMGGRIVGWAPTYCAGERRLSEVVRT